MRFGRGDPHRDRTQAMNLPEVYFGLTMQKMMKMRRRR